MINQGIAKVFAATTLFACTVAAHAVYPIIDENGNKSYEKEVDENGSEWLVLEKRTDAVTLLRADSLEEMPKGKRAIWAKIRYLPPKRYGSVPVLVTDASSYLVYDCANKTYAPTNTVAYGVDGKAYESLEKLSQEKAIKKYSLPLAKDTLGSKVLEAVCTMNPTSKANPPS